MSFKAYTARGCADGGENTGWVFSPIGGELPLLSVFGEIDVPDYTIAGTMQMPSFEVTGVLDLGEVFCYADIELPSITGAIFGGGFIDADIPSLYITSSGASDIVGKLNKNLPRVELSALAFSSVICQLDSSLNAITIIASGFVSPIASMNREIPHIMVSSSALQNIIGSLAKYIPSVELAANAYWGGLNSASLSIPAITLYAHAQSAIWEMISVNTKNNGLTNYSNYEYNSLCVMNDQVFGAKSDGIYLLEGDDDDGEDISWSLKTGKIDVENELSQRVRHIWFSRRSSGDLLLIVNDGENEYEYPVTAYSETDDAVRVKLGKGIKSKYIQLELKNIGNEALRLDSFKVFADRTPRKR